MYNAPLPNIPVLLIIMLQSVLYTILMEFFGKKLIGFFNVFPSFLTLQCFLKNDFVGVFKSYKAL